MNPKEMSLREKIALIMFNVSIDTGEIAESELEKIDQLVKEIQAHYKARTPQCKFYYIDEREYSGCNHSAREVSLSSGRKDCPDPSTGCPLYEEQSKARRLSEEDLPKRIYGYTLNELKQIIDFAKSKHFRTTISESEMNAEGESFDGMT